MLDQALWLFKSSGRALIGVSFVSACGIGGLAAAGEWIGVLFFTGLMVLWVSAVTRYSRSMNRAARDFAQTMNWSFRVRGESVRSYKTSLRPFDQLDVGRVGLLVSGHWGQLQAESFVLQGPAGDSREQVWVALLRLPRRLPTLELLPTTAVTKSWSIGRDVEVESAEFNSRWRVKSPDMRFGHAILHPRMVERILGATADYSLGIDGDLILVSTRGASTWSSGRQLVDAFTFLADFVELIPDHVWRAYAERPSHLDAATQHLGHSSLATSAAVAGEPAATGGAVPAQFNPENSAANQWRETRAEVEQQASRQDSANEAMAALIARHESVAVAHEVFTASPKHNGFARRAFFWSLVPLFSAVGIFWGHRAVRAVNTGTASNRRFAHFALAFAYLTTLGLIAWAAYSVVIDPTGKG